jgi:hypothetical protein
MGEMVDVARTFETYLLQATGQAHVVEHLHGPCVNSHRTSRMRRTLAFLEDANGHSTP